MPETIPEIFVKEAQAFFERDICLRATKPLKNGIQIALYIDNKGPLTLTKNDGLLVLLSEPPKAAELSFWIPAGALQRLSSEKTEDIGEMGVAILKLMVESNPNLKVSAKVHIGLFDLVMKGYMGVIPLGGATVMKFLASKGMGGIGKIKEGISRLRH